MDTLCSKILVKWGPGSSHLLWGGGSGSCQGLAERGAACANVLWERERGAPCPGVPMEPLPHTPMPALTAAPSLSWQSEEERANRPELQCIRQSAQHLVESGAGEMGKLLDFLES